MSLADCSLLLNYQTFAIMQQERPLQSLSSLLARDAWHLLSPSNSWQGTPGGTGNLSSITLAEAQIKHRHVSISVQINLHINWYIHICMSVGVCFLVYVLLVCLFVCLLVCLFVCLFICLFVCLFACLFVCLFALSIDLLLFLLSIHQLVYLYTVCLSNLTNILYIKQIISVKKYFVCLSIMSYIHLLYNIFFARVIV